MKNSKGTRKITTIIKDWGISKLLKQNKEALNIISKRK